MCVFTLLSLALSTSAMAVHEGWGVDGVEVSGLPGGIGGDVTSRLALAAPAGFLGGSGPVFQPELLSEDTNRLLLLLSQKGYPYARIETDVTPLGDRRVRVRFTVTPHRPVLVGAVTVTGEQAWQDALAGLARSQLPARAVFTDQAVATVVKAATLEIARAGYADAKVNASVELSDSFHANVDFAVAPGERSRIVGLAVEGVPDDLEGLALKSMGVAPGTMFSPDLAPRAQNNLRELQLFRQVRVKVERSGPGQQTMRADLAPGSFRSARISAGSWSDDAIRVRAGWKHRNIFQRGRGLGFRGAFSLHVREIGGDAWWPALLGSRSLTNLGLSFRREDEESYDLDNITTELSALLHPADRLTLRLSVLVEDVSVNVRPESRDEFEDTSGRQLVFAGRMYRDRSDNLLYPTNGSRLTLDGAISPPEFLSGTPFVSVEATGVVYAPLPGGVVLATRVSAGAARPLGDALDLLPNRRFFAGGVTSMRGAKRRRLGPVDDAGDPVGGAARVLAAAELRVPLIGFLEAAVFFDSGQVWSDHRAVSLDGMAMASGGGLVFHTPVGPVRIDLAGMITDPNASEPRTVLHVAIGHPF